MAVVYKDLDRRGTRAFVFVPKISENTQRDGEKKDGSDPSISPEIGELVPPP